LQQDKTRQLEAMIRQENEGKEVNTTKQKRNPTTTMEGLYENAFRETWASFRLRVRHTACPNDGRPVTPHWARHRLHVSDSYQPMELATCSDDLETAPGNLPADSPTFYHNVTELPLVDNPARGGYAGSGRTESFSRS